MSKIDIELTAMNILQAAKSARRKRNMQDITSQDVAAFQSALPELVEAKRQLEDLIDHIGVTNFVTFEGARSWH